MAPLAPLSSKSTISSKANDGFDDMFDDLLDAPAPTKTKKSKSKSKSKKSSKSSKKTSKNSDYDYGDRPLSPNLGNSMDDINFDAPVTFAAPSNIEEGDLDDSILGGMPNKLLPQLLFFMHILKFFNTQQ
jgi:hypothetical protein